MFDFFLPLLAGILTSFTPCVAVLFPITFYRFISQDKIYYSQYILYVFGFVFSFVIIGMLFQNLFTSHVQNGIKLGIAIFLMALGILQFFNKINPLNLKPIKNTFMFGMIFAIAVGINPCSLPYLATVVALAGVNSSLNLEIFIKFVLFALGILIAPTLLLIFGNTFLHTVKKISKGMHKIDKLMASILFISGIYMGLNILALSVLDIIASSLMFLILIIVIIKIFFVGGTLKDLLKIPRISLIASFLILWFIITYHCYGTVKQMETHAVCSVTCTICQQCMVLFTIAVILGIIGFLLVERYEKRNIKK